MTYKQLNMLNIQKSRQQYMLVYNVQYSILDMAKWTTEKILELLEESEVNSDKEDMDCGPVVEGSEDEFDYMSEYESDSDDRDDSNEALTMPGHVQTKLVAAESL